MLICLFAFVNLTYFFSYFGGEEFQHLVASWWLNELVHLKLSNSSNVYKYSMMYLCCQMTLKHQKISKLWKTKGTVSNPRQHFPEWVTVWVTLTSFFLVILFQALHCKNIQKARELWDSIMTKGNAKFANMWLEYYNLERYVSACLMPWWWNIYPERVVLNVFLYPQVLWRPRPLSESSPQSSPVHLRLPWACVWSPAHLWEGGRWVPV